ncbi:xanthine dehydrogenase family protein molybdopterin-binding subunit [Streptomyces nitrosporeus]|uniref:Xanthine dehydrogenase family protein molybdopterin-binding subunit n=1 Tax=Streptomyces nitrosporeus TaxID=28894 RepID=A0A5J6FIP0_9ACTN|nr:xanthine dehydrogenase family protein molybdopterin-binding subunit [Streptomyces nitrosporeus]QEU76073.1 xanthine dehydrogenase family protein molybdopterin-binding subunit [Streptomyces nitrosporeus]GGZ07647.1 xanthine dehydrogenase [Streptomyces nitrosporeus]
MSHTPQPLGAPLVRREGREKVTGTARYAAEHHPPGLLYGWIVPATVPSGRVTAIRTSRALALPGVHTVLTHENAPRLGQADDPVLRVLQDARVPHRGWPVALVVAGTLEAARAGADAVHVTYGTSPHDVVLTGDHPGLYTPEKANGGYPAVRTRGDAEAALAAAPVGIDATYTLGALHNHPMEPHASTARWDDGHLTVHDSSQGSTTVRDSLCQAFGLGEDHVTVVSEHVGGGFGSKGTPRPQVVLAVMAARHTGRPVQVSVPRRHMAALVGHRAPTVQRVRLGADRDGVLRAVSHEIATHTSRIKEFVEQAAVPARVMYASPHSRTVHRVAPLDVPSPSWMRAPGECPGMYALESAMDELACALGTDPVELRLRNEPVAEPDSGRPFSSRGLAACLTEGARRFGWYDRDPRPAVRQEGGQLIGTGVASATYPVLLSPSTASVHAAPDGSYTVRVNATDIGTGARTVLAQIAAAALETDQEKVTVEIGSSDLPAGSVAGGSSGTASWGTAVHKAATALVRRLAEHGGTVPPGGITATAGTEEEAGREQPYAQHAFGAHFAEVAVDSLTGEVRVRRMLGVFAAGRILNARTARSQFIGGMVMGLGMALTEGSTMDPGFGDFAERDLASYHIPTCADVTDLEAHWIEEDDPHLNPMGSKGIGEIGIVGSAAAVGNAVRHATGARLRSLPITPDTLLPYLP